MNKVSYTQYSMHQSCPYQYKLVYIDKIAPPSQSIDLIFGTAMHVAVQEWLDYRFNDPAKAKTYDFSDVLLREMQKEFKNSTLEVGGLKIYPATVEQLMEYYEDGVEIIRHVYKYANDFFPTKNHRLVGIELEINEQIRGDLHYIGYLDIVVHDEKEDIYYIIDLKTSRTGWGKWAKTDEKKKNQALLYKRFYSQKYGIPEEKIVPKFIILKRQIAENTEFTIKRLSNFIPSHGKISMTKAWRSWESFINECFDEDGNRREDAKYPVNPSKSNCMFCPFRENAEICASSYYLPDSKEN